jgi:ABC-type nitrate/sulfonate/bicarbonate transport system ATPase subunit
MMIGTAPAIELHNLRVRFGPREIIHGIDLSVAQGEFVAIVGRSGCGKSTLLNALAGFVESEGEVRIPGNFGFVFQNYAAFPWLTVRQNLLFGMHRELKSAEREQRLMQLLIATDLSDEAGKYPAELSGGQEQRVAIARALARDPSILLMDEPFGALDIFNREKMQAWLLKLYEVRKQTVIFVTHSIEEAILLSDRIIVLADGSITGSFEVPFGRPRENGVQYNSNFMDVKKQITSILEAS